MTKLKIRNSYLMVAAIGMAVLALGAWYLLGGTQPNQVSDSQTICSSFQQNGRDTEVGAPGYSGFDGLKQASDAIVLAKVINCARGSDADAKHAIMDANYSFDVTHVFKGPVKEGKLLAEVTVLYVDGVWELPKGVPKLSEGQEVVLFLWKSKGSKYYSVVHGGLTIGISTGKPGEFRLGDDPRGTTFTLSDLR